MAEVKREPVKVAECRVQSLTTERQLLLQEQASIVELIRQLQGRLEYALDRQRRLPELLIQVESKLNLARQGVQAAKDRIRAQDVKHQIQKLTMQLRKLESEGVR